MPGTVTHTPPRTRVCAGHQKTKGGSGEATPSDGVKKSGEEEEEKNEGGSEKIPEGKMLETLETKVAKSQAYGLDKSSFGLVKSMWCVFECRHGASAFLCEQRLRSSNYYCCYFHHCCDS